MRLTSGDPELRRQWCALGLLAVLASPAFAGPAHRPVPARVLVAGASGSFDRVPAAAERIAAGFGIVTSTFRTIEHNRAVGGVPNSFHLLGRAIDIARRPGITHSQIAAALRSAGFMLIESLDEGDHSHFAFGPPIVRQAVAPAQPPPSSPPAPAFPRIAADDHGLLLADTKAPRP